jgi:hypothetical protein
MHYEFNLVKPSATTFNKRNEFMAARRGRAGKDDWNLAERSRRPLPYLL